MKQLSQDLSHTEEQLKAVETDKAAAGREQHSAAQQAVTQQINALNARVSNKAMDSKS